MNIGALLGPVVDAGSPRLLAEQAREYAGEGFTSLWTAQAIGRGFMVTDPFVAMTVAATVTEDVEIGSAILQLPLYQSADLAHRVLSLQQICGDRLLLGVGAGSTANDFAAFGRSFEARFRDFTTTLADLRTFVDTGEANGTKLSPWPAVLGKTKFLFGTWGKGVARAATDFDGWIASGMYRSVDELEVAAAAYQQAGGGRAIVSTIQVGADSDLGELRERFARYAAAGFDDAVVMLMPGSPSMAEVRVLV